MKVIREKKDWNQALNEIDSYDFYNTYDYHKISKNDNEDPILFMYSEAGKTIVIPFLLRKIFDTEYYDLTSVYGYSGPLSKNVDESFDNTQFKKEFLNALNDLKIVSVFSRLHPFINYQKSILDGIGDVTQRGSVVNIDLTKDITEQRTIFSKTTKRYINKIRKLCDVKKEVTNEIIDVFLDLYYENMDRVNAHKSYYFTKEYIMSFFNSEDFETEMLSAVLKDTGEVISAAMMIKTNNIIQYHISGTRNDFLNISPIRVLIDEMRITGTEKGYEYFNLGGGLGGSSEDSLFNFKASFSKDFKDFEIWKHIVNDSVYNSLSKELIAKGGKDFFPLYRAE